MYDYIDRFDEDFNGVKTGVQYAYSALLHSIANGMVVEDTPKADAPNLSEICEYKLKRALDSSFDFGSDDIDEQLCLEVVNGDIDPSSIDVQLIDH